MAVRSEPDGDTRGRILAEASRLIRDRGVGGLSMRKLAGNLGLTATALYRHFKDKERLISAVCVQGFELFARSLWSALEAREPLERLQRASACYLDFGLSHPNFYRIMFMTPVDLLGWLEIPEENQQRINATFQFLVDRVKECLEAELLLSRDARELSAAIWAHCHGLVALRLDGHFDQLSAAEFREFFLASSDWHLRGLRPA